MKRSNFRGKYVPHNPEKYRGNAKQIVWRSSWERLFMIYCDKSPKILNWSSEEIKIPYLFEDRNRSYYPDFWIDMINKDGERVEKIIEIKPHYQRTMKVNKAKWKQAEAFCKDNNYEFVVLTERELF